MEGFGGLGVEGKLVEAVEQLGFEAPTGLQRAAIPVLRRGANIVIHASSGAGVTLAYGIPLLERMTEAGDALSALVVTPTDERAIEVAERLGRLGHAVDVRVAALSPSWSQEGAAIVVVTAGRVMPLIRTSQLKLEELKAVVVDGASAMLALGAAEALETVLSSAPKDAQRVIVTSELDASIEHMIEAHVRRPMHIPPRAAVPDEAAATPVVGTLRYTAAPPNAALALLAGLVSAEPKPPVVYCRTAAIAREVESALRVRGLKARAGVYGERATDARGIGYGSPPDAETLRSTLRPHDLIVVTPAELAHLRMIAPQAHYTLEHVPPTETEPSALERFRDTLRSALREEDIEAQLLVLGPLLEEASPAEIAAAAVALLRKRTPRAAPAPTERESAPAAFVKLFLGVGSRDGIAAREIVGAITGEAQAKGDQVGRVEIRDTFSVVEVEASIADRVIKALNGTSMKGRSLRVDYDRKGPPTGRTNRPPRRTRPTS